jgi:hypothetical protein
VENKTTWGVSVKQNHLAQDITLSVKQNKFNNSIAFVVQTLVP